MTKEEAFDIFFNVVNNTPCDSTEQGNKLYEAYTLIRNLCLFNGETTKPEPVKDIEKKYKMTYKEAYGYIEDVQRILTQNRFIFSTEVTKAMGMALEAMEKQIGEKPNFGDGQHYCECGNILKSYEEYCDICGQKIDWNEPKENSDNFWKKIR